MIFDVTTVELLQTRYVLLCKNKFILGLCLQCTVDASSPHSFIGFEISMQGYTSIYWNN